MRGRFAKFGLELHPGKTRLIEFGRFAARDRAGRGLGIPETFDFLGYAGRPVMPRPEPKPWLWRQGACPARHSEGTGGQSWLRKASSESGAV